MYIVIDGGTTNTRIYTVEHSQVTEFARAEVGAGKPEGLSEFIRNTLRKLPQPDAVIASGMITSASGLYELPHLKAPAGIRELHQGMKRVILPEISHSPIYFIPGVRTEQDMMRGEETELAGLSRSFSPDSAYILPGTHSKCIQTDQEGRIADFFTLLTGELLSAVKTSTIAGKSFDFYDEFIEQYLKSGFEACKADGINAALFQCRTLAILRRCTKQEIYSFCLGAVLCPEVERILRTSAKKLWIGGKKELRIPEALLLRTYSQKEICCLSEEVCNHAAALGAVRIFETES